MIKQLEHNIILVIAQKDVKFQHLHQHVTHLWNSIPIIVINRMQECEIGED
jgi:hypothetical protein